ncbi:MAG: DUF4105 domain-containing protein [Bacteroidota bacterium]
MKLRFLFCLFSLFLLNFSSEAQQLTLSDDAQISILTVGPGANLNDKFGHNSFRIKDTATNRDWVFNYGTYDFSTPNFYTKFARGKLLYSLSVESFENFYNRYQRQNRWVKEQVLNLDSNQRSRLFEYLINNAQPENKDYKYDFFFDNCATRIRDVLVTALPGEVQYQDDYVAEENTFRELIAQNVNWNSWGSLGMDIAIGAVTDVNATPWEHQFLPDFVFEAAQTATVSRNGATLPLVSGYEVIYENTPNDDSGSFFMSPLFVFGLIALLLLWVTYRDYQKGTRSRYLDALLFLITGLIGVFLLLLWFATDHSATANNFNLLWAFPFSILFITLIAKKRPKNWLRKYIVFLLLLLALLTLHSITGIQRFALALVPFFVALAIRYLYVVRFLKAQRQSEAG